MAEKQGDRIYTNSSDNGGDNSTNRRLLGQSCPRFNTRNGGQDMVDDLTLLGRPRNGTREAHPSTLRGSVTKSTSPYTPVEGYHSVSHPGNLSSHGILGDVLTSHSHHCLQRSVTAQRGRTGIRTRHERKSHHRTRDVGCGTTDGISYLSGKVYTDSGSKNPLRTFQDISVFRPVRNWSTDVFPRESGRNRCLSPRASRGGIDDSCSHIVRTICHEPVPLEHYQKHLRNRRGLKQIICDCSNQSALNSQGHVELFESCESTTKNSVQHPGTTGGTHISGPRSFKTRSPLSLSALRRERSNNSTENLSRDDFYHLRNFSENKKKKGGKQDEDDDKSEEEEEQIAQKGDKEKKKEERKKEKRGKKDERESVTKENNEEEFEEKDRKHDKRKKKETEWREEGTEEESEVRGQEQKRSKRKKNKENVEEEADVGEKEEGKGKGKKSKAEDGGKEEKKMKRGKSKLLLDDGTEDGEKEKKKMKRGKSKLLLDDGTEDEDKEEKKMKRGKSKLFLDDGTEDAEKEEKKTKQAKSRSTLDDGTEDGDKEEKKIKRRKSKLTVGDGTEEGEKEDRKSKKAKSKITLDDGTEDGEKEGRKSKRRKSVENSEPWVQDGEKEKKKDKKKKGKKERKAEQSEDEETDDEIEHEDYELSRRGSYSPRRKDSFELVKRVRKKRAHGDSETRGYKHIDIEEHSTMETARRLFDYYDDYDDEVMTNEKKEGNLIGPHESHSGFVAVQVPSHKTFQPALTMKSTIMKKNEIDPTNMITLKPLALYCPYVQNYVPVGKHRDSADKTTEDESAEVGGLIRKSPVPYEDFFGDPLPSSLPPPLRPIPAFPMPGQDPIPPHDGIMWPIQFATGPPYTTPGYDNCGIKQPVGVVHGAQVPSGLNVSSVNGMMVKLPTWVSPLYKTYGVGGPFGPFGPFAMPEEDPVLLKEPEVCIYIPPAMPPTPSKGCALKRWFDKLRDKHKKAKAKRNIPSASPPLPPAETPAAPKKDKGDAALRESPPVDDKHKEEGGADERQVYFPEEIIPAKQQNSENNLAEKEWEGGEGSEGGEAKGGGEEGGDGGEGREGEGGEEGDGEGEERREEGEAEEH